MRKGSLRPDNATVAGSVRSQERPVAGTRQRDLPALALASAKGLGSRRRCQANLSVVIALLVGVSPLLAAERFPTRAEDVLIVDCLLPGQVRKIGRVRAFLTPRQPARVSQFECELRGGEYVEYDQADLGTALATWSGKAAEGDPVAMVYVGEAYAKGIGGPPDYASAGFWFDRAAALGSARAKQNLGHLFELGLGRPKDIERALNLYREAAGVESGELVFATDLAALREDVANAQAELAQARAREQGLRERIEVLQGELGGLRDRLRRERAQAEAKASAEMEAMWLVLEEEIRSKEQALADANERMLSLLPAERQLDRLRTDGPFELRFERPMLMASRSEPLALVSEMSGGTVLRGQVQPAPLV
ncbi:MAG: SEL1-like repeat protein, partial [Myxococcales bacterium]|nr:SEL1-like repeat protein [Myxococcales bacterium]